MSKKDINICSFERKNKSHPVSCPVTQPTKSEIQLHEDEIAADYRDYCMYQRIVNALICCQDNQEVSKIIRNVTKTRNSLGPKSEECVFDEIKGGDEPGDNNKDPPAFEDLIFEIDL
mmetsp:Transcript_28905/g.43650  ORF Transcript_28905/g.43650 Transcript_28905/m.43650 type:complete len:117 (-) Transcript_28905:124-474(-)